METKSSHSGLPKPRLSKLALLLGQILVTSAYAEQVIVVNSNQDHAVNTECTLRNAIAKAKNPAANTGCTINGTGTPIQIRLALSGSNRTINLNSELLIESPVEILGPDLTDNTRKKLKDGTEGVTISGGGSNRIFRINSPYSQVNIANLALKNGSSTTGGGLYAQNNSSVALVNTVISGNTATNKGGGLAASGAKIITYFTDIDGNTAHLGGGGIHGTFGSYLFIGAAVISNNTVVSGNGGGIIAEESRVFTILSSISANKALAGKGGGVFTQGSLASPGQWLNFASSISSNQSSGTGGVHMEDTGAYLVSLRVENNVSSNGTGGLFVRQSLPSPNSPGVLLHKSRISGNRGGAVGAGGITSSGANLNLARSSVTSNSSGNVGGIYSYDSTLNLTNSTISSNTSSSSKGGIYANSFDVNRLKNSVNLIQVTVSNNVALSQPPKGGLEVKNGRTHLLNSIFSGNSHTNCALQNSTLFTSSGHNLFGNSATIDNCIYSMPSAYLANAVIAADPLLLPLTSVNDGFGHGHELHTPSPAIGAGNAFLCGETLTASRNFLLETGNTGGDFSWHIGSGGLPYVYRESDLLNGTDQRDRAYIDTCDLGAMEYKEQTMLYIVPLPNGGSVIIPL